MGGIKGGIMFYEGQLDDARHTMMIARTAAAYDALVATSARVTGFLRDGERVIGATVRDLETGRDIEVKAKTMVNAAGVWTDEIQQHDRRQGPVPGARRPRACTSSSRGTASTPTPG